MDQIDELIVRSLQGCATPEEMGVLAAWRRASSENQHYYEEVAAVWGLAGAGDVRTTPSIPPRARDLVTRAAAGRNLAAGGARRRRRFPAWLPWAAATAATVTFFLSIDVLSRRKSDATLRAAYASGSQIDTLRLAEGSIVHLGPNARLRVAVGGRRRDLWLEGAAHFAVASLRGSPFTVHTAAGIAEARGTQFVVRTHPGSTQVVVLEGVVAAWAGRDTVQVKAGEIGDLVLGTRPTVVALGPGRPQADWLRAALVFEAMPLRRVATVLTARYHLPVIVTDSVVGARTVSAWFAQEPTFGQVLRGVCRAVGTRCTIGDSGAVIGVK
ncbi:MAG: FecR domain-containing protein [Gemmatimonadetes bacterium]|nr:FecR domain-containing protein [Gemmatimonadota bacterium]